MYFTVIIIILVVILNVKLHKNSSQQDDVFERFWEREQKANATRKKDISSADYITIPIEEFPCVLKNETEQKLRDLSKEKILNLTGYSNTDLKLKYGQANLGTLSAYDENFGKMVTLLGTYGQELYDSGYTKEAQAVLEYAVSKQCDSKKIYVLLANIYNENQQKEKLTALISSAEELRTLSRESIISALQALL